MATLFLDHGPTQQELIDNPWSAYWDSPLGFAHHFWPRRGANKVVFYQKQRESIESVRDNVDTYIVAAHQMGKDYLAGFTVLWYFLCHHPVRVITTSVKDDHLRVLWGELGRFIDTCNVPLKAKQGGPLICKHREMVKLIGPDSTQAQRKARSVCTVSYCRGMVSERPEGMAGHHARYTLLVVDEASGVDEAAITVASSWAKRRLIFGNPYNGGMNHWFERHCREGDIPRA